MGKKIFITPHDGLADKKVFLTDFDGMQRNHEELLGGEITTFDGLADIKVFITPYDGLADIIISKNNFPK